MKPPLRRCALYTRKSSEEGLEQNFNSLDAQREACAAYVKSQASEGWRALPDLYDDGGYSGGSMERPGLQQLLADIAAGRVDIVVVYKIDRLTRALADFARMVELFEQHGVSFVSVTQAFNTTTSMGRLTLNVLLSFAQFEREVTGERIRDKIAASKKKGMWMGGNPPLGYDLPQPDAHALAVNAQEAEAVRLIFRTYLGRGSVPALMRQLEQLGIRSKARVTRSGKPIGGRPFSRGALYHLLRNRVYLGEVPHRDQSYPGLHAAILDADLFGAVQDRLDANATRRRTTRENVARSALTGRVFDADDQPMSPTFAYGRRGRLYRYYVSASVLRGAAPAEDDLAPRRVAASRLETELAAALTRVLPRPPADPLAIITRAEVHPTTVELLMPLSLSSKIRDRLDPGAEAAPDPVHADQLRLVLPWRLQLRGGKTEILAGAEDTPQPDPALIRALRKAHAMLEGKSANAPTLAAAPTTPWRRRLIRLALLAPDIQRAILDGRQPADLTLAALMAVDVPLLWSEQRDRFKPESGTGPMGRR